MTAPSAPESVMSVDTSATLNEHFEPAQLHTIPSRLSRAQSRASNKDVEKSGQETPDSSESAETQLTTRTITGLKWFMLSCSLYVNAFLYGLDTTIAADVQGPVIETFAHIDQLAWVGAGFPMGSVSIILLITALFNSFNMKWIYLVSVLLFEVGSALCGAAPNMTALIVGRVIAGMGGSGLYLGSLNYFSAMTVPSERGLYISLIGFFWGVGAILGPVIGGAFAVSSATWRWAFYINLIVGAISIPILLAFLPPVHPVTGVSIRHRVAKLDIVGFLLMAGVWVTFTLAFTMAGAQWPWNDGRTIATIVVFAVLLVSYILQQAFCLFTTKETRSFPVHLLRSRTQILLYIGTSANITVLFVVVYFIPIYFQFVHGDSAIMAAVRLMPYVIITCVGNIVVGHLIAKLRMYMLLYVASGIFLTLGSALLLVYLQPSTSESTIYGLTVLVAIGSGMTLQSGYSLATFDAPVKYIGDALSLQNISQIGSTVIALVIAGQVFQSSAISNLESALAGQGFSQEEIVGAVAGAQSLLFQQLTGELREAAVLAITNAMQKSFSLTIVAGGVLLLAGLVMKRERLTGEIVTA